MVVPQIIDWDEASNEERRQLYRHVKTLKKRMRVTWSEVFLSAFGPRDNVSDNYEDNLRKGRISPEKAYKLFAWLYEHDPGLASNVEDDILGIRLNRQPEPAFRWEHLLAHSRFSNVEVCTCPESLGMAGFARREPVWSRELKLLEEFYFKIVLPFSGTLVAFQGYKGYWHPQLLGEGTCALDLSAGQHVLPSDENGEIDPLWEECDIGKHSFVFLLTGDGEVSRTLLPLAAAPQALPAKLRDEVACQVLAMPVPSWALFRINIMFR